jgi:hypothetical protein
MYYSAPSRKLGWHCIAVAVARTPGGPFVNKGREPIVCQPKRRGSIDPFPFVHRGRPYLLWKSEGVAGREPTRIWAQRLSESGLSRKGRLVELLHTQLPWEQPIIENPAMFTARGNFYLLYSANRWWTRDYVTGYAVCRTPLTPCRRLPEPPLLWAWGSEVGTGGASVTTDVDGSPLLAYHAWTSPNVGYPGGQRTLRVAELDAVARGRLRATNRRAARY